MKNDFEIYAEYYDQIYSKKNYEYEAEVVKRLITKFESVKSATLLDVGCGTGEHLRYLSKDFQCTGVDVNRRIIDVAKSKLPHVEFEIADMVNFRLESKFDVIICLFSAIGYVRNFRNLVRTLQNFRKHLNDHGLVLLEPWIFKKDFKKGHISLDSYEENGVKLVRMGTSEIAKSRWLIHMHYLLGKNGQIRYIKETHMMLALEFRDYDEAFKLAQLRNVRFLEDNLWNGCRGLFVATKHTNRRKKVKRKG